MLIRKGIYTPVESFDGNTSKRYINGQRRTCKSIRTRGGLYFRHCATNWDLIISAMINSVSETQNMISSAST